jgi:hypothetical protein
MVRLGAFLAPSSHCSILIETTLASKAGKENDLSLAPMGLTSLGSIKFNQSLIKITRFITFLLNKAGAEVKQFEQGGE